MIIDLIYHLGIDVSINENITLNKLRGHEDINKLTTSK